MTCESIAAGCLHVATPTYVTHESGRTFMQLKINDWIRTWH